MNIDSLLNSLELSEQCGHTLTTEEGIILHNSLLLLKNENHFRKIFFWGKIYGTDKDYYVAFGYTNDALKGKIFYYSTNCIDWGRLPLPTANGKLLTPLCRAKFQGDPAIVLDILLDPGSTYDGKLIKESQIKKLKEEDRLSATIFFIMEEVAIVPRGGFFKRPDGVVVENLSFEGLSALEAREFKSYLHNRLPTRKWNTNLLERDDYNYAMDFLDPLDIDIPEGCWTFQFANGGTLILLKSFYWPGMNFYHYLNTIKYGFVYIGHGKKSLDIPFLLNPFL